MGGKRSIGAVPRGALRFVEVPYGAKAAARALYGAPFRREIGIPDGVFPSSWGEESSSCRLKREGSGGGSS